MGNQEGGMQGLILMFVCFTIGIWGGVGIAFLGSITLGFIWFCFWVYVFLKSASGGQI